MDQTVYWKRHRLVWDILYYCYGPWLRLRYNYHPKKHVIQGPALIVSNHCTDYDPIFLGLTVKTFSYYVASGHMLNNPKKPFFSWLVRWGCGPIGRMKGDTGSDTALGVLRRLKKGFNVIVFPEGNRTFNGTTADIVESTAKLARISGAKLVTHRFRGGYLTCPRWGAPNYRRGLLTGEVVREFSPEELKAMKPAEIAGVIRTDIYENAYETQAEWKIPYKGKNLAKNIERVLCICPSCRRLGTLESHGNSVSCRSCGLTAEYTELGYLEGKGVPFHTVLDWDRWQAQELQKRADTAGENCIAEDDDIELAELTDDFDVKPIARGRLAIFRDRLECAGQTIRFADLSGMGVNAGQTLIFTWKGRHFNLQSDRVRNLRKYLTLYHAVTAPDKLMSI